ncbi:MAG TPA: DUF2721 domain-containing protein [Burkholderiales bacterium]|nr:DUF2721 domain-containing protein [Burkholderiales bacterium]
MEHNAALNAIQLAVAPVFMLTAIATLIGALANRLARIIDRARDIEERLDAGTIRNESSSYAELDRLKMRGLVVNASLALLTVAATLIGATVLTLFVGETSSPRTEVLVPWGFIGGVVCFILALLCFLTETLLAAHTLKFARRLRGK